MRGNSCLENVLDVLLDSYLNKHGREEKAERARDRKKSRKKEKSTSMPPAKRRHIPSEIRRTVFERDGYACSYIASDGTCCKKTGGLEIDHILPVALGGDDREDNLRVLCREHNQFFARKVFGAELIEKNIKEKV